MTDDTALTDDSALSEDVTFWFDPSCPYTWRTSRWLLAVTGARNLTIDWRLMSLAILNEDKEIPERFRAKQEGGRRAAREAIAVDQQYDTAAAERLYTCYSNPVNHERQDIDVRW